MQLTAVEFATLIRDLRCDMRPEERRVNPRAPTRSRVEVIPVLAVPSPTTTLAAIPTPQSLRVRDISRTGLGLITAEKVEEGRRFLVLLPKTATDNFVLLCEVARVTRLPGDMYGIGMRLVRRVGEEERAAFMSGNATARSALLTPLPAPAAAA